MRHPTSAIALMLTAALTAGLTPTTATAADTNVVSSVSSFPKATPRRDLLAESVATSNDKDWGGIETLNVPHTKSQAQKDAETAARQRAEAKAASRSATRPATTTGTTNTAARQIADASGSEIVQFAASYTGVPYVYGGTTPAGWDCSGFTSFVFAHFGVTLSHSSEQQRFAGVEVPASEAQPGDLMWKPGHVGIYAGNGMIVHASTPRTGTIVAPVYSSAFHYYRITK